MGYMALYAVIAKAQNTVLQNRIALHYPDFQAWSDQTWIVHSDDTAEAISLKLGVSQRDSQGTVTSEVGHVLVVKLAASYWGFGPNFFWDWLRSAFQRSI
jgi:hypothetical protein